MLSFDGNTSMKIVIKDVVEVKWLPGTFPKTLSTAPEHPPQVISTLNSCLYKIQMHMLNL